MSTLCLTVCVKLSTLQELRSRLGRHFYEFERPDVLPPYLGYSTPLHFKDKDDTLRYVIPDFFFAFNVNARAVYARIGYFIEEVGKAPDVVFEVASISTIHSDLLKRILYRWLGVKEYWGFDPTGGNYYGTPLFGLILEGDEYVEVEVEYDEDTGWRRAYSPALDMFVSAVDDIDPNYFGAYQLRFQDPRSGKHVMTPKELYDGIRRMDAALRESRAKLRESIKARIRILKEQLRGYES